MLDRLATELRTGEIAQQQHRSERLTGDELGQLVGHRGYLSRRAMAAIHQQDALLPMRNEPNAIQRLLLSNGSVLPLLVKPKVQVCAVYFRTRGDSSGCVLRQ